MGQGSTRLVSPIVLIERSSIDHMQSVYTLVHTVTNITKNDP